MRTTVTLDPDVQALLKKAMRERDTSFKQALNDGLRQGLRARAPAKRTPFRQITFDMGPPLVDLTKANALAGELEDLDRVAKLKNGR
jgi:hypothetical protein